MHVCTMVYIHPSKLGARVFLSQIIQFCTSGVCLCVTIALMASGAECAGPRAMLFNLGFNATLLWQFGCGANLRNLGGYPEGFRSVS